MGNEQKGKKNMAEKELKNVSGGREPMFAGLTAEELTEVADKVFETSDITKNAYKSVKKAGHKWKEVDR